ncbi:MAG: penicillin-binding protein 2, partial [Pseudomonadales bacterium]
MAEPLIIKDHRGEAQIYIERVTLGAILVAVLFGLLLVRIGYLQFVRHDAFVTRSDENRMQLVAKPPSRGLIFDAEGQILAENLPARQLVMIPEQIRSLD